MRYRASMRSARRYVISFAIALACLSYALWCSGERRSVAVNVSSKTADSYSHRIWQARDGLFQSAVQSLAQTSDGYLWIGTSSGLVRFDGNRFVVFNHKSSNAFHDDSIWSLATGRGDTLWIGTEGGGLIEFRSGVFRQYGRAGGLSNLFIRAVYEDRNGTLWVGTDQGLFKRRGDLFDRVDAANGIPRMNVYTIYEDANQTLYVGGSGLLTINASGMQYSRSEESGTDGMVGAVRATEGGALWVGTFAHLRSLSLHPWSDPFKVGHTVALNKPTGLSSPGDERADDHLHVSALAETRDGSLWIGSYGDGLLRYKDGHFRWFRSPDYLVDNNINAILSDPDGGLWVGTQNGLVLLKPTEANTIGLDSDSPVNISSIYADREGFIFMTTLGGRLLQASQSKVIPVRSIPRVQSLAVRTVFRDGHGILWLGTSGQGLHSWDGQHLRTYSDPDFVRAFAESPQGKLWVATDGGVMTLQDGQFKFADGLGSVSSRALCFDRGGTLWLGTDTGIERLREGIVLPKDRRLSALDSLKVWSLLEDSDGNIWLGTRGSGLFLWDGARLSHYSTKMGFPKDSVYSIIEDANQELWMSGPDGIWSVNRQELIAAADQPRFTPKIRYFGVSQGVATAQMSGGVQPAGVLSPTGDVWFAGSGGAVRIHPGSPASATGKLAVLIEEIRADGREISGEQTSLVPANAQQTAIAYTAIRLASPEGIRFRYRLEGLEERWTDADSRRVAYYTHVPPGHYRFHVIAYDLGAPGELGEASTAIVFQPHFYQTGWFYACCALISAVIIWLGVYLHRRRLQQRFEAVLAERNRVAREMHDTLIQGCVGVSTLLEAAASIENTLPDMSRSLVERARAQVKMTVNEAREALWMLRHEEKKSEGTLGTAVQAMAELLAADAGIPVVVEDHGAFSVVSAGATHDLLLIIREAVSNSLRHAKPEKVVISIEAESDFLHISISDDGQGFSVESGDRGHFGLIGMRERAAELDGELSMYTQPGSGTDVHLRVPIRGLTHERSIQEK